MAGKVAGSVVGAAKKDRVSLEVFLQAWEGSTTVKEVANKTGLKETSIQARASKYRNDYGIPLKNFTRGGGAKIDKQAALAFLANLRGVEVSELTAKPEAENQSA